MKKSFLLFLTLICATTVSAQDLIVKTDSTRVEARVTEVAPDVVRYKAFTRPNGPTYVLPVAQIGYIRYEDGFVELYANAQKAQHTTEKPAIVVDTLALLEQNLGKEWAGAIMENGGTVELTMKIPAKQQAITQEIADASQTTMPEMTVTEAPVLTQRAPMPNEGVSYTQSYDYTQVPAQAPTRVRYEVGQYYNHNGVEGIVCAVDESGSHGLIMSLDEVMIEWSTFRKKELVEVGASHRTDGAENMLAVERYIADKGGSWEQFPAFKWCRDKGEGWYLPSIDELLTIGHNYNGGSRLHNNRQARVWFNEQLKENGGVRMDGKCYYHSSTEQNDRQALMSHMGLELPYVINTPDTEEVPKYGKFLVRAVHRF